MWKENLVSHLETKLNLSSLSNQNCHNFSATQPMGTVSLLKGIFWHPDEVQGLGGLLYSCLSKANNLHRLQWLHLHWNLSELGYSLHYGVWLHCSGASVDMCLWMSSGLAKV